MENALKLLEQYGKTEENIPGFDNCWSDSTWRESQSRPGTHCASIKWDFDLNDGSKFTDIKHQSLLHTSKEFLLSLIMNPPAGRRVIRTNTFVGKFHSLRMLVSWMIDNGIDKFSELDKTVIQDYVLYLRERKGIKGKGIVESTFVGYVIILCELYLQREKIPELPQKDLAKELFRDPKNYREYNSGHWPYTPDDVAIPLVTGAIRFLREVSTVILDARDEFEKEFRAIINRGYGITWADARATEVIKKTIKWQYNGEAIEWVKPPNSCGELSHLLSYLVPACFIVLSYLVGMRGSEIVGLKRNCVTERKINGRLFSFIKGKIYKLAGPGGRPHEWPVPESAVFAINVLERYMQPLSKQRRREELWLVRSSGGRTPIVDIGNGDYGIRRLSSVNFLLNKFARFLNIPKIQQSTWHLSTHQGRKTFARFIASRDKTALVTLSEHLGHFDRLITEQGYGYFDDQLQKDIGNHVVMNSIAALELMFSFNSLAGKAGTEIRQIRERFYGEMTDNDIRKMAEMCVDAGLLLGVCDWGFCVYRSEYSACHGTIHGPNPVQREPGTCMKCKNFVVTEKHKGYYVGQRERYRPLMQKKGIPEQTREVASARYNEADQIIRSLESDATGTNK